MAEAEASVKAAAEAYETAHAADEKELAALRVRVRESDAKLASLTSVTADQQEKLNAATASKRSLSDSLGALKAAAEKERKEAAAREAALQDSVDASKRSFAERDAACKKANARATAAEADAKLARDMQQSLGGGNEGGGEGGGAASVTAAETEAVAAAAASAVAAAAAVKEAQSALERERQSVAKHEAESSRLVNELTGKNNSLQSLGTQLRTARDELQKEKAWAASLQGKVQELTGDADNYAGTIAALQAALRTAVIAEAEPATAEAAAVAAAAVAAKIEAPPRAPGEAKAAEEEGDGEEEESEEEEDGEDLSREEARQALTAFYSEFNPSKLEQVEYILDKYDGAYHALFTRLRQKYASEQAEKAAAGGGAAAGNPLSPGAVAAGGAAAGEKLAAGWSNLMGGLNERVRDAGDRVRDAVEKGKVAVEKGKDNLQRSGKLDEIGAGIDKLKENAGKLKEGLKGLKLPPLPGGSSSLGGGGKLPPGWAWARDADERPYFFNRTTGEVTYRDPRKEEGIDDEADSEAGGAAAELHAAAGGGGVEEQVSSLVDIGDVAQPELGSVPAPLVATRPDEIIGDEDVEALLGMSSTAPTPAVAAAEPMDPFFAQAQPAQAAPPAAPSAGGGAGNTLIDFGN